MDLKLLENRPDIEYGVFEEPLINTYQKLKENKVENKDSKKESKNEDDFDKKFNSEIDGNSKIDDYDDYNFSNYNKSRKNYESEHENNEKLEKAVTSSSEILNITGKKMKEKKGGCKKCGYSK